MKTEGVGVSDLLQFMASIDFEKGPWHQFH